MGAKKRYNGDGSFRWLEAKRRWEYKVTLPNQYTLEGKPIRKSFYGKTQDECRHKAREAINRLQTGLPIGVDELTVEMLAIRISDEKLSSGIIQEQTYDRDMETIRRLAPIGKTILSKASPTLIKSFLATQRHYSDATLKKEWQMLRRVFKTAQEDGIIEKNPMNGIRRPRSEQQKESVRALTREEERRLVNVLLTEDIPYGSVMLVALFTGMRIGEILALQVMDVDFTTGTINICKTMTRDRQGRPRINDRAKTEAGTRTIRVADDVIAYLKDCIGNKGAAELIFEREGHPISTNTVNGHFSQLVRDYDILTPINGKKVSVHALRHTYATRCIEAGMAPVVLMHRLGHTSINITIDTYTDVFQAFEETNMLRADLFLRNEGLSLSSYNDSEHKGDPVDSGQESAKIS